MLQHAGGRYYWMTESYPAEQVSLRTASTNNVVIIEQGPEPRVVGEVDRASAPLLVHEQAIYIHAGQQYQVEHLDWENAKAYVTPVSVDYYTDAHLAGGPEGARRLRAGACPPPRPGHRGRRGSPSPPSRRSSRRCGWRPGRTSAGARSPSPRSACTRRPTGSRSRRPRPRACAVTSSPLVSPGLRTSAATSRPSSASAIRAISRQPRRCARPTTSAPPFSSTTTRQAGTGLAERIFEIRDDLIAACAELVATCPCSNGCPSCVGPQIEPRSPAKAAAETLLGRVSASPRT